MSRFEHENLKLSESELQQLKERRLLEKKIWNFLKELTFYTVFLLVLYAVAYSNSSVTSINYNKLFMNTFITTKTKTVEFNKVNFRFWPNLKVKIIVYMYYN